MVDFECEYKEFLQANVNLDSTVTESRFSKKASFIDLLDISQGGSFNFVQSAATLGCLVSPLK